MGDLSSDRTQQSTTLVQVLSLYLLLLAFFVVLYNHSRVEDAKRKAVFGSLQATFTEEGARNVDPVILYEDSAEALGADTFKRDFGNLVRTEIPVASVKIFKQGRQLQAQFPTAVLFDDGRAAIRPDGERMLSRVAAEISRSPQGVKYELSIQVGSRWLDNAALGGTPPLAIARASALAKAIERHGSPQGAVASGVDQGHDGFTTMSFYLRPANERTLQFLPIDTGETR